MGRRNPLSIVLASAALAGQPYLFGPAGWKGGVPDPAIHRVWPESICWRHGQSSALCSALNLAFAAAQDWSGSDEVSFWMHSERATGSSFMVLFFSENLQTEGPDSYAYRITLDWTGWKQFTGRGVNGSSCPGATRPEAALNTGLLTRSDHFCNAGASNRSFRSVAG